MRPPRRKFVSWNRFAAMCEDYHRQATGCEPTTSQLLRPSRIIVFDQCGDNAVYKVGATDDGVPYVRYREMEATP